ncbi:hypothetical protein [Tengunoibacter tsumagoiensis]|uniref:Cytochrome b561 domain-containing protein n=1 Tax=Tengunoibacter tsumagoiensis TaxID=2014871 RepID=A0A402A879_9CHLR|nr:hypothetical protein [Tengunoibacter tsumagoiensis]GCE15364.1 hypothetical protein KTT_52230 [Tengunoibacter tsumagoiensis]
MKKIVHIIHWISNIAGTGALVLGLLHWFANRSFLSVHMLFGLVVTLALLALSIVLLLTRGMRVAGALGIIYAMIIPLLGMNQFLLLIGNLHWLVRVAHLLVSAGAMGFVGIMSARYLKQAEGKDAPQMPAPQIVRQ